MSEIFLEKKYREKCPYCGSTNIWKHLITGEYSCACGKAWFVGEEVAKHYLCSICGEVFDDEHSLEAHMVQVHKSDNPKKKGIYYTLAELKVIANDEYDATIKVYDTLLDRLRALDWMLNVKVLSSRKEGE